ncbi:Pre-mRNA-splicing factor ATP-dependent RNA helicase prp16 [Verticillium dahliae VDG1]|nr:Pre-mRNA-splicing factor ATP-dependent RNA helicase prp16 [Verticillium dahliae VDG1]
MTPLPFSNDLTSSLEPRPTDPYESHDRTTPTQTTIKKNDDDTDPTTDTTLTDSDLKTTNHASS